MLQSNHHSESPIILFLTEFIGGQSKANMQLPCCSNSIPFDPYLKTNQSIPSATKKNRSSKHSAKKYNKTNGLVGTNSYKQNSRKCKVKIKKCTIKQSCKYRRKMKPDNQSTKKTTKASINAIVDTGATRHCSNTPEYMENIRETSVSIVIANGTIIHAAKMGDIGVIKDVLYVPEINHQLLFSVKYFLQSNIDHKFTFNLKDNIIQLKQKNKLVAQGVANQGELYILKICV